MLLNLSQNDEERKKGRQKARHLERKETDEQEPKEGRKRPTKQKQETWIRGLQRSKQQNTFEWPKTLPAGTGTTTFFFRMIFPFPAHSVHGDLISTLAPPHARHVDRIIKGPVVIVS